MRDNGQASREFLKPAELKQGYRLACQTHIHGDVVVFVPEQSRKRQQVIRKEATLRDIRINPAVKKYTLDLEPVTLHDPLGDWERLQNALVKTHKLKNLSIDYTVLQKLQNTIREKDWQITVSVWHGKEIIDVTAGKIAGAYGLAVDIGTTTLAGYLCDLKTGDW